MKSREGSKQLIAPV